MSEQAVVPTQPSTHPNPSVPVGVWIVAVALICGGGLFIGATQFRSRDEYLRERLVGKWKDKAGQSVMEYRNDGTFKVTWFSTVSVAGAWRVEKECIYLRGTHGGNTFSDVLMAPERWIKGWDPLNVKTPVRLIDDDHMKVTDGVWERIKTAP